jgi:hypothetical protein
MNYALQAACGLAVVWAAWPLVGIAASKAKSLVPAKAPVVPAAGVGYEDALLHLSAVRNRLKVTEHLGDDQKKAIDILTLALVDGSDV